MTDASTSENVSTGLSGVVERARRDSNYQFYSLAHLIDEPALERAYRRLRKDAAEGVDGVTVEAYGRNLKENLRSLYERLKSMKYRHQPILRVHIPKESGKTRPLGISTVEDKVVQGALKEILEVVFEPIFLECSHGFRPKRSAHDAIRQLNGLAYRGVVNWILEADIVSFFDSVIRKMLVEMLQKRVLDGSLLRLVGKCLHVGVLDGEEYSEPGEGTTQGSIISPLFGNVYLHYALDLWFEEEVRPRLKGEAHLIRYADDFLITFEDKEDAERVYAVLGQRMEKFGLTLHPDKTRLLPFRRPPGSQQFGKGPKTFDFLGFTCYWKRTRSGRWEVAFKTRRARLRRAIRRVYDFCRRNRHQPVKEQHASLKSRLQGHINYFGVNGNAACLIQFVKHSTHAWLKWLRRRSNRARGLIWERFEDLLRDFPLPKPLICVQIWGF